jgi:hypothetical protein
MADSLHKYYVPHWPFLEVGPIPYITRPSSSCFYSRLLVIISANLLLCLPFIICMEVAQKGRQYMSVHIPSVIMFQDDDHLDGFA